MESNVKVCMNCKYCSYNVLKNERRKKGLLWRFFNYIFNFSYDIEIKVEREVPRCTNENVYRGVKEDELDIIFGNKVDDYLFCSVARTSSSGTYHCCGREGKYFEKEG